MKIYFPILLVCFTSLCQSRSIPLAPHAPALHRRDETGTISDSEQALIDTLANDQSATAMKANGAKSYMIDKSGSWTVSANEDCQAVIGPKETFGSGLDCSKEGEANCKVSVTIKNTESFSDSMGFTSSFSLEASGKAIGVTFKASTTQSTTRTYTHTYGQETSVAYDFPVPYGKKCTPTRYSYRMKCKGQVWHVNGADVKTDCDKLQDQIDFTDEQRIFQGPDSHFWYVNHRSDGTSELYEMRTFEDRFPPTSCAQVTGGVWVRQMDPPLRSQDTEGPLSSNGHSLSAIACIFGQ